MQNSKVNVFTQFFKQTFRRHTGGEYSELLTRGMHGEKGINRKYPWAYIRLFALILVLLAVFLLIIRFTYNELFAPTVIVLSSTCFNFSFLLFLYELYPKRDLSFLLVCLAMLLGGAAANVVSQVLFDVFRPSNEWLKAVYSGLFEELPKAAVTLLIIVLTGKRSPLAGFVFGAAVGCGFSIVEDMGYIFVQANQLSSMNLTTVIEVAFSRGASAFCTHILWTGAVGWAYCNSKKYLANIAVYLTLLLSCGLHIAWDLPLPYVALAFVYAFCAAAAVSECICIVHYSRKKVFESDDGETEGEESNADEDTLSKNDPEYWSHWGRFTIAFAAFLMAVIAVIYCSIPFRETYGTETFTSPESFIEFMQDGVELNAKTKRAYVTADSANDILRGEYVVQCESESATIHGRECNLTYEYWYSGTYDSVSGKDYHYLYTVGVKISDGISENTYMQESIYTSNGELYANYFRLTESVVTGYNFESNGDITAFIYDADFVRDYNDVKYLWLFCTFAALFGVSAICYVSLRIKSWRVKKQCSTENVSSAK